MNLGSPSPDPDVRRMKMGSPSPDLAVLDGCKAGRVGKHTYTAVDVVGAGKIRS